MANHREAAPSTGQAREEAHRPAGDPQRHLGCGADELPVAGVAPRVSPLENRVHRFLAVAEGGSVATGSRCPSGTSPTIAAKDEDTHRSHDREPIRENDRGGRRATGL